LGDTRVEAIVFDNLSRRLPQTRFYALVQSAFSDTDAAAFLHHFGFKTESVPYEAYRDAMRLFLSAAMLQIPNFGIAESPGPHTYLCHLEIAISVPRADVWGPITCALFMYNNESYQYSESTSCKKHCGGNGSCLDSVCA
jgi:hypothetical protein